VEDRRLPLTSEKAANKGIVATLIQRQLNEAQTSLPFSSLPEQSATLFHQVGIRLSTAESCQPNSDNTGSVLTDFGDTGHLNHDDKNLCTTS